VHCLAHGQLKGVETGVCGRQEEHTEKPHNITLAALREAAPLKAGHAILELCPLGSRVFCVFADNIRV